MVQAAERFDWSGRRNGWNNEPSSTKYRCVAFLVFISAGMAKADGSQELYYSLTGPGGVTASFYLPVNPTIAPDNVEPGIWVPGDSH